MPTRGRSCFDRPLAQGVSPPTELLVMIERRHSVCRVCHVACDLVVTLEDGEIRDIRGSDR